MLTPKETGGRGGVYPVRIDYSALCESGFSSSGAVATNATMALGWKPTAVNTAYPLCDPTHHYLLTIRKAGATVTVWKQDVELGSHQTSAATYAELLAEALTAYAGAAKGYVSRLVVVESALDYAAFYQPSNVVGGLWGPRSPGGLAVHSLLDFGNAVALGADTSGNGNNWTLNSAVQSVDTPTNNQATLNPVSRKDQYVTLSNGNRTMTSTAVNRAAVSWFHMTSGKWYWEVVPTSPANTCIGITDNANFFGDYVGHQINSTGFYLNGHILSNGNNVTYGDPYGAGDVVGVILDMDVGAMWFTINGVLQGGATMAEVLAGDFTHGVIGLPNSAYPATSVNAESCTFNFDKSSLVYPAPTGFRPLCDMSLPDPAMLNVDEHYFSATFIAPAFAPQYITVGWDAEASGFGLRIKNMGANEYWHYISTVAGLGYEVLQGQTGTQFAKTALSTPVMVAGDTIRIPGAILTDGDTYLVEVFRIGAESGFNIVAYTGDGISGRTVPHGLGRAPFFGFTMSNDGTARFKVSFSDAMYNLGGAAYFSLFNDNGGWGANATVFNCTRPDATNVTLGNNVGLNEDGHGYTMWVWSDHACYRSIEFLGNGLADGPFVELDGRLRGILASKGAGNSAWAWGNTAFSMGNPITTGGVSLTYTTVFAPEAYAVALSTGYKIITTAATYNTNGWGFTGIAVVDQTKYRNAF